MTERDKNEIAEIIRRELHNSGGCCEMGFRPDTVHELISLADTWKHTRRFAIGSLVAVAVGGMIAAMVAGIKVLIK